MLVSDNIEAKLEKLWQVSCWSQENLVRELNVIFATVNNWKKRQD